jgi:hypothetical protein
MDVEVPPGYYSGHYIGDTPNSSASERTLFPPQFRKHSLCQQLPAVTYKVLPLVSPNRSSKPPAHTPIRTDPATSLQLILQIA